MVSKVATTSAHLRDAADKEVLSAADVTNAIHVECPVKSQVDTQVLGYVLEAGVSMMGGWEELLPSHLTGAGDTALYCNVSTICSLFAMFSCECHSQRSQSPVMTLSALSVSCDDTLCTLGLL